MAAAVRTDGKYYWHVLVCGHIENKRIFNVEEYHDTALVSVEHEKGHYLPLHSGSLPPPV